MAPHSINSTVAAGLKPFLRESVNAVRGTGLSGAEAAKIGNVTLKTKRATLSLGREADVARSLMIARHIAHDRAVK